MRPTFAEVNLTNLKYNYLNIRKRINQKKSKIMAVVKADAYGHGVKEVVKTLNSLGKNSPEYFAVALPEEGAEVRSLKVKQPILIFEPVVDQQASLVFQFDLTPTVFEDRHLNILLSGKEKYLQSNRNKTKNKNSNSRIRVHVKIDTGMNRLGIKHNKAFDFIKKLSRNDNFVIDGIYTHFATSDERDKSFANLQLENFNQLIIKLKKEKINYGLAHAANSGAILDMPDSYFDMVRPGISLYGYYPSLETSGSIKLKPVMSLISYIASVKEIENEETVSYGRLFKANGNTKIASVPIGYADGFNRNLTNLAAGIIRNKIYSQVGRVTMDRIMFDVGNDTIKAGDKIILLGKKNNIEITAWDWGKILNTIPYEITCGISKRVPRIYVE